MKKNPKQSYYSMSKKIRIGLKKWCGLFFQDSVICLGEDQTAPEKSKTQKPLRTLNEVLGKASSVGKESKTVPGRFSPSLNHHLLFSILLKSHLMVLYIFCLTGSKGGKMSGVISIFDDSSSENSQDDEQFKARREFLKSGLPETFRKQIAKTAANKEAFSLSCSSFQPVIHMSQPSNGKMFLHRNTHLH